MNGSIIKRRRVERELQFDVDVGDTVMVDGVEVAVRMVTATQVLVHINAADEWIPFTSRRVQPTSTMRRTLRDQRNGQAALISDDEGFATSGHESDAEDDECSVCGTGGRLTCCDVCPRVYHLRCLPSMDSAALRRQDSLDDWWCPHCKRLAQLTFHMFRIVSSAASADVAQQLFEFMLSVQPSDVWEPLREAGVALEASLSIQPQVSPTQHMSHIEQEACQSTALQLTDAHISAELWDAASREWGDRVEHAINGAAQNGNVRSEEQNGNGVNEGIAMRRTSTSEFRGVSRRHGNCKARFKQSGHDIAIGDYEDEMSATPVFDQKVVKCMASFK
mmetsp:Transcript_66418/g.110432  ORF Transcript_66418/g.110432 Transcript_66418/m.110432 type:complete len:334 (+) Transcript_66418:100-1101(+)|eukprot:CAMPEP_0119317904 /NCGR_PEP_ID=MMETSP1333-20130426/44801_1 /TAXON_ID=418940 /ORGANISM="Scyphosphaera apsteinii, Strain RCC1455" /LENGTH=333 /DNA_ID=CAMNT_0007323973 /DNA_START=92 /DNA_END=1093 /DNA_ORIENTATION=+